jgi:hypothetical protein
MHMYLCPAAWRVSDFLGVYALRVRCERNRGCGPAFERSRPFLGYQFNISSATGNA